MYSIIDEAALIQQVKETGNNEALIALTTLHSGILYQISQRYSHPYKSLVNSHEMFSSRFEVTYNACQSYKKEKSQFNSHLGTSMKWFCLKSLKKLVNEPETNFEFSEIITYKDSNFSYLDCHEDISDYFPLIKNKKLLKVLKMRYVQNLTLTEIGLRLGCTHTYVGMLIDKVMEILRRKIKKVENL